MRPENEVRLRKIRRISGILRAICKVFFVPPVVLTLLALSALVIDRGVGFGLDNYTFMVQALSIRSRFVVGAYFTLRWGAMFLCVYRLHRLLGNYSRGEIFSRDSGRQIRQWGIACVLWGAMKFLWVFVPGAVLPHPLPIAVKGHIAVMSREVKVQSGDMFVNGMPVQAHGGDLMLNGLIIIGISWFMEMAVEIREENDLTV
jgi:hypothetical protein